MWRNVCVVFIINNYTLSRSTIWPVLSIQMSSSEWSGFRHTHCLTLDSLYLVYMSLWSLWKLNEVTPLVLFLLFVHVNIINCMPCYFIIVFHVKHQSVHQSILMELWCWRVLSIPSFVLKLKRLCYVFSWLYSILKNVCWSPAIVSSLLDYSTRFKCSLSELGMSSVM